MARTIENVTITGKRQQTIRSIQLETPADTLPDDHRLVVIFEEAIYKDDGSLQTGTLKVSQDAIRTHFGYVKDVKVDGTGAEQDLTSNEIEFARNLNLTIKQLAGLIKVGIYTVKAKLDAEEEVRKEEQRKVAAEGEASAQRIVDAARRSNDVEVATARAKKDTSRLTEK